MGGDDALVAPHPASHSPLSLSHPVRQAEALSWASCSVLQSGLGLVVCGALLGEAAWRCFCNWACPGQ